jgi:WD40 repeat protein
MRRLHGPTSEILGVWFARGGSLVLAEEVGPVIWGWDVSTGAVVLKRAIEPGSYQFPRCAVGTRLVAATRRDSDSIDTWSVDGDSDSDGKLEVLDHRGIGPSAVSYDDATVAMKRADQIVLWDAASGGEPIKVVPHRVETRNDANMRFSRNGRLLVFGGCGVGIVDLASKSFLGKLRSHFDPMGKVDICEFGDKYLVAGGGVRGQMSVWGLEEDLRLPGHLVWSVCQVGLTSLAFTPDGKYLLVGGPGSDIVVRGALTGTPLGRLRPTEDVNALAFSRDGTRFVSGGTNGEVLLWDWPMHGEEN